MSTLATPPYRLPRLARGSYTNPPEPKPESRTDAAQLLDRYAARVMMHFLRDLRAYRLGHPRNVCDEGLLARLLREAQDAAREVLP